MNFYPLVVSDIVEETSLAKSFTFQVEDKYQSLFNYQAGQFLSLRLPWQDSFLDRCYSLSNSPNEGSSLKITVKRVKEGRASNLVNDTLEVGDIVDIAPPSGRFVPSPNANPITLFAAGSGITPIISIIKHTLKETELTVRLFYANSTRDQIIFEQELTALSEQYPNRFNCHHHLSSDKGRVNETSLKQFITDNTQQDFFICGPAPFMDLTESALQALGIDDKTIFVERFIADTESALASETSISSDIASFNAILDDEQHSVPYLAGKTLLESMLAHDLKPAYFCQKARCGMCTVTKKVGDVIMRNSDILSKSDVEKGQILLCQSLPLTADLLVNCDTD
jgi:3-ketosteroid 9alpha-monooxygenase subunit B